MSSRQAMSFFSTAADRVRISVSRTLLSLARAGECITPKVRPRATQIVSEVLFIGVFDFGLKREAVAPQTPEFAVAGSGGFDTNQELVGRMETAVRVAFGGVLALGNRDAGAGGFANV